MALREVIDANGALWSVYSVVPTTSARPGSVAPAFAGGWLCFQRGDEKWRHLGIPPGWSELTDEALLQMISSAEPVRSRLVVRT
ncbi:MAG: hypothetical protein H0W68_01345 [Gemmatimonadaceae bacterium]|nr:hypothetical protein [Gemmatimonadaceae bacterium]